MDDVKVESTDPIVEKTVEFEESVKVESASSEPEAPKAPTEEKPKEEPIPVEQLGTDKFVLRFLMGTNLIGLANTQGIFIDSSRQLVSVDFIETDDLTVLKLLYASKMIDKVVVSVFNSSGIERTKFIIGVKSIDASSWGMHYTKPVSQYLNLTYSHIEFNQA
jgi:hypothetical protein